MELVALNVNGRTYNIAVEKKLDPCFYTLRVGYGPDRHQMRMQYR